MEEDLCGEDVAREMSSSLSESNSIIGVEGGGGPDDGGGTDGAGGSRGGWCKINWGSDTE